jgi:hypothetical protein
MTLQSLFFAALVATASLWAGPHEEAIAFISENLLVDQPIVVEQQADAHLHARLLSWGETLSRYFQSGEACDQEIALAERLLPLVRDFQDPKLNRAVHYHVVRMIRHHGELEPFLALRREVVASRLGITADKLLAHSNLEQLIVANDLDLCLFYHDLRLTFDRLGQPLLPFNGRRLPLPTLLAHVPVDEGGQMTGHMCTYAGIVPGTPHTVIQPFKRAAAGAPALEIVSADYRLMPHAWLRLRSADGAIYSIGRVDRAVLSPDPVEYMADPDDVLVTPLTITQQQLSHLLAYATELQHNDTLFDDNASCCAFVKEVIGQIALDEWNEIADIDNLYQLREWQRQKKIS